MVRAAKRSPPAGASGAPGKKPKVDAAAKASCDAMASSFAAAEDLPTNVRHMLDAMLAVIPSYPDALRNGGADCQGRGALAKLFSSALANVGAGIQTKLNAAEIKVNGGDDERKKRDAVVERAKGDLTLQQNVVREKQDILMNASAVLQKAKDTLNSAQATQRAFDTELVSTNRRFELLQGGIAEVDALKLGSEAADSSAKRIEALVQLLGTLEFDPSLLTALPTVLSKTLDSRGAFDNMVVSQLETDLGRRSHDIQEAISKGEIEKATCAERVGVAEVAHGVAHQEHAMAEAALSDVLAEQTRREDALRAAQKAVKDLGPELLRHACAVDAAQASLRAFREGPEAAFMQLTAPLSDAVASAVVPGDGSQEPTQATAMENVQTVEPALPIA